MLKKKIKAENLIVEKNKNNSRTYDCFTLLDKYLTYIKSYWIIYFIK